MDGVIVHKANLVYQSSIHLKLMTYKPQGGVSNVEYEIKGKEACMHYMIKPRGLPSQIMNLSRQ